MYPHQYVHRTREPVGATLNQLLVLMMKGLVTQYTPASQRMCWTYGMYQAGIIQHRKQKSERSSGVQYTCRVCYTVQPVERPHPVTRHTAEHCIPQWE
ncbi:hypothetical protein GDO81_026970 [Engystomops pustulosus]|uniref:C2H2-type domain-containing protein n=1 Tax=Engystomops pustulosus TaxID=76066 RepID=A0AAV6ZFM0_ENGPU|nr:hypothetical protein GDO81_026970 [Engystomops pustulosus]